MIYMEEELIEQVRASPILYDLKNRGYRNQALRKEAWDEIGEKLGRSGEYCKETWNKLRNAYTNALNRRKSRFRHESSRKMPKWTFEDQMSFLPVALASRPKQTPTNSIEDETQEHQDDDYDNIYDAEEVVKKEKEENAIKPSPLQIANEAVSSDQSDIIVTHHFQTSSTCQEFATPRRESKQKNTILEATMNEMVTVMKNHNQMLSRHLSQNNYCTSHDEDEMYFLSLARFVKKLNPAERIRVKGDVSQIIFQAELRNLTNDEQNYQHQQQQNQQQQQQHQQELPSTSQHATSEQYFSEIGLLHPKTEKE